MSVNISADGKRTLIVEPEWRPCPDGMEQALVFQPGYNGDRSPDPRRSYGVHGMEIRWYLRGPKGGAWVAFSTEWIPGDLTPGHGLMPPGFPPREPSQYPDGCGLGWCGLVPQYEGHEPTTDAGCLLIPGGTCYTDMSYTGSDPVAVAFTERGEAAVWEALEDCYAGLKAPEATS
jgi:hypothetical protein